MQTITIEIKDEGSVKKFFDELFDWMDKEKIPEESIKIDGLTPHDYYKHYVIDSE